MKKLFTLVSVMLCMTMLVMNISAMAVTVPPDPPDIATKNPESTNPYTVFKRVMDTSCSIQYAEIKGDERTTTSLRGGPPETNIYGSNIKLIAPPDQKLRAQVLEWNQASEITGLIYAKDGYYYDSLYRERFQINATMESQLYGMVGTGPVSYKDHLKDLTVTKRADDYELRYKILWGPEPDIIDSYTVVADRNYMLKSVKMSHHNNSSEYYETKSTSKYEFVSVNEPFTIDFPHDLSAYKLVD